MVHINEPKGVDFIIESEPLTEAARKEITAFIQNHKKQGRSKQAKSVLPVKQPRVAG